MGDNVTRRKKSAVRRNDTRFRVPEGTFAEVKDSTNKVGRIIDISKGGLAFHYIDIGEKPSRSFELDIITKNKRIHTQRVEFKKYCIPNGEYILNLNIMSGNTVLCAYRESLTVNEESIRKWRKQK